MGIFGLRGFFNMNQVFTYIEILGAFALAISGALTAIKMRFDGFGILIIAFVTAVGGGTLRDILTNREVFWISNSSLIYAILLGTIIAIIFKSRQKFIYRPLMLFDAIGLGFFTVVGVQIGIDHDLDLIICIILGAITGTFGGILRDILVNEIPIIFRKEIYATLSIIGGLIYFLLQSTTIPLIWVKSIPIFFIIIARLIVLKYNLSLPSIYSNNEDDYPL